MPVGADKAKALESALNQIEKAFGKGAIMRLGTAQRLAVEVIPTGILPLDIALGVGGLPRGRVIEIFGPEGGGKTSVCLQTIAEVQKTEGIAVFIDAEHALSPSYAAQLGVNLDNLLMSQPDNAEQALEIAEALVRSGAVDIIVVDSVAALAPQAELEGEMGDAHIGLQARLMSQALRKLCGVVSKSRCCLIFVNQLRERVGGYGITEVTPGGRALKFYASVRIDVRRGETLKRGAEPYGHEIKVRVVKNKVAPPFREAKFNLIWGQGISREETILDLAVEAGLVEKSGAWYSYNQERMGQGKENTLLYLKEHPELIWQIENAIRTGGIYERY